MTFSKVQRILADILGISEDQVAPGTKLSKANGLEMTSFAKLIMRLERACKVTIHDEDVLDFACVEDLVEYIDACLSEGRDDYKLPSDQKREAWYYE